MSLASSKLNKLLAAVLTVATIGAALTTTTQQASAHPIHIGHHGGWGHHGWGYGAAGLGLGLGLIGAAAYEGAYVRPCRLVRQYDDYGNYLGRVRVCRPDYD